MAKKFDDISVRNCIADIGFDVVYPEPGRGGRSFVPHPDTIDLLLAKNSVIEFRKKSVNSANAYKVGYILEVKNGLVSNIVCYDSVYALQHLHDIGVAASYDDEVKLARQGYIVSPQPVVSPYEIWFRHERGFICKARYHSVSKNIDWIFCLGPSATGYDDDLKIFNAKAVKPPVVSAPKTTAVSDNKPLNKNTPTSQLLSLNNAVNGLRKQMMAMFNKMRAESPENLAQMEDVALELGSGLLNISNRAIQIRNDVPYVAAQMNEIVSICKRFRDEIPKLSVAFGLAAKAPANSDWFRKNLDDAKKSMKNMVDYLGLIDTPINAAIKKI